MSLQLVLLDLVLRFREKPPAIVDFCLLEMQVALFPCFADQGMKPLVVIQRRFIVKRFARGIPGL